MANKVIICGVDTSTLPKLKNPQFRQVLLTPTGN